MDMTVPYVDREVLLSSRKSIARIIDDSTDFCKAIDRNLPLAVYGMGNGADKVFNYLNKNSIEISAVFASDDFVRGQDFRGHSVEKLSSLEQKYGKMTIVVGFGSNRPELIDRVQNLATRHRVFIPDFPVVGEGLFTKARAHKNLEALAAAHSLLADEQSKMVFEKLLGYKISAEPNLLWGMASHRAEIFTGLLKPSESEIFIDGGAYRGDSIDELLSYTNGKFSHIIAFEPDKRSFKQLNKKYGCLKNVELKNAAILSRDTQVTIEDNLGRGTRLNANKNGGKKISAMAIDSLSLEPTYIKLDLEGEELSAIEGAKNTIANFHPKLNIALYHRAEDFFKLPLYVHSLDSKYRLYIRQHMHFPAWDLSLIAI